MIALSCPRCGGAGEGAPAAVTAAAGCAGAIGAELDECGGAAVGAGEGYYALIFGTTRLNS